MAEAYVIVIEVDADGGNTHHVIPAARHAQWLAESEDGTSGQDRDCYSDEQDRESYTVEDPDSLLALARDEGFPYGSWSEAEAQVRALGGTVADVIAATEDDDE